MDVNATTLSAMTTSRPDADPPRQPDKTQAAQAVNDSEETDKPRQRPQGPRGQNLDITA